jgi:pyruvate dehydrogenase (quinone)
MANALPHAIGAQIAYPNRQVITFSGDGGLSMLMGELLTVAQYKLPIKIVVYDNHRLGMVQLEQEAAGMPHYGVDLTNPNFAGPSPRPSASRACASRTQTRCGPPSIKRSIPTVRC